MCLLILFFFSNRGIKSLGKRMIFLLTKKIPFYDSCHHMNVHQLNRFCLKYDREKRNKEYLLHHNKNTFIPFVFFTKK